MHAINGRPREPGALCCDRARGVIAESFSSPWQALPSEVRTSTEASDVLSFVWDCLTGVEGGADDSGSGASGSEAEGILRVASEYAPDLLTLAAEHRRDELAAYVRQDVLRADLATATRAWFRVVPWSSFREFGFMLDAVR